jgi:hypothetical protein
VNSALRARRRILALFPPSAAVLLLLGEALTPKGLDHPISMSRAAKELPIAEAHLNQLYLSNLLVIFGLGALGVSFAAIAVLVRDRGSTIATVAAVLGGLAGFCGGLANVLVGYDLAAAAIAHTTPGAAERILVSANRGWAFDVVFVGYVGGLAVATVLTTVSLLRSRAVPRWLPVLFVVGVVLAALAPAGVVSIPLQLPITVALIALAIRIWGTTTLPDGLPQTSS